ncbi:sce7725 family protein [Methylobacterium sp. Leaf93]|uniref:sce7725 family protein n=1 Tax=Methylobacterium sp. Leaf93 TaxID=1736249 RepID=UPI0006F32FAB|nr:sce7725 family protein [Methylobacterium sp. Leaf93]KQP13024.1 ATP-binding protein [Methylobacterium sp. Leaf93]
MYHPYFRGKQFELITVREMAPLLAQSNFVPIIEPVRESLGGLGRTLKAVCDANGRAIVIVNPHHGDHGDDGANISALLQGGFIGDDKISAGILLRSNTSFASARDCFEAHKGHNPTFVHSGFNEPKALAQYLGEDLTGSTHVFVSSPGDILYRRHFNGSTCILVQDGFERRKNADYADNSPEKFSELHVTYRDIGMAGFGDFLVVGDVYSEGGGPAYAVAIHLTYIDPDNDDVMFIYHFVSTTNDTPTDPAGKFKQALDKLIRKLDSGTSKLRETESIMEFRELHAKQHFPGLGYVKKLSMKHHIETLATYLG